jgi:hypothetical protein
VAAEPDAACLPEPVAAGGVVGRCRALQAAAKEGLCLRLESVAQGAERLLVSLRAQELGLQCGVEL